MKMKRFVSMELCALMLLPVLAGCGAKTEAPVATAAPAPAATEAPASAATEAAPAAFPEDVQKIVDRGVLRVGVKNTVLGFGFQDELTGEYTGMEISLAEKIADYLGVDVEFTAVTAATRTELLDSGDIDCVLATFTIPEERKKSWLPAGWPTAPSRL